MSPPGRVAFVCASARTGEAKRAVARARLLAGHGLEGDAHAGPWHRQLSLLDAADIARMREAVGELEPGAFGENVVVEGVGLAALGAGSRLALGEVTIELTQVGKVCHTPCAISRRAGTCIMPRTGLFAVVVTGGEIGPGSPVAVVEGVPRERIQAAVLTVSDRGAAGVAPDTAGPAVAALLGGDLGARVAWQEIVADDAEAVRDALVDLADRRVDIVVTAGGTGCGPRDVTPEATRAVIQREVPGLAEAMRAHSLRVTPHAMLQRGVAGIRHETLVVNLPGSEKAARENLAVILPALGHAVASLRGQARHPAAERARSR
jgi:molybdenum cofactor synthesis domain-containing protein